MKTDRSVEDVFLIDGARTAIGSPFRGLKELSAVDLAVVVIKELLRRNKIPAERIDEVILGNGVMAGLGQNPARQAAIAAGLPVSVPGITVSNACGAGLQSVILAAQSIIAGEFDCLLAGGTESASRSPYLVHKDVAHKKVSENLLDSLISDGLWCSVSGRRMGELSDYLAREFSISRIKQDAYAMESHLRAVRAESQGRFKREIVPVALSRGRVFKKDERPRKDIDLKSLQNLKPVFSANGTATAASSSVPCDGAAVLVVASKKFINTNKIKPKARILGYASVAVSPEKVFAGSVYSIQACLKNSRLSFKDVDLFEIDEAFATQAIFTSRELKIPDEKINLFGGDISLGHPLGAAGARILVTLMHSLIDQGKKKGIASVCLGGGGSLALAIEIL